MLYVYGLKFNDNNRDLYLDLNDRAVPPPLKKLRVFAYFQEAIQYKWDIGEHESYHAVKIDLCKDYTFKDNSLFYKGSKICTCNDEKNACIKAWNHAKTKTLLLD